MPTRSGSVHRPFAVLKEVMERARLEVAPETDKIELPPKLPRAVSDEEAFERAMEDVRPLGWSARTPLSSKRPLELRVNTMEDDVVTRELEALVAGHREMDPFETGEGVEGAWSQRGRRYLGRLKRGEFSVQGHLDLHGFGLAEARVALEAFLRRSQQRGYCCVRVVHGRGTHSSSEPSVLKRELTRWLSSRRLSRTVIAYASARWKDGGGGAVYVLLYRRWRPPRG